MRSGYLSYLSKKLLLLLRLTINKHSQIKKKKFGFVGGNEEAHVRGNAAVVDGHDDVCASDVMTHVNDDDADDGCGTSTHDDFVGASTTARFKQRSTPQN